MTRNKQVLAHLKVYLLKGKKITSNQALSMWRTSRLSEYIRRLRSDYGMKIYTEMIECNGDVFASYSIRKPKKVFHS